VKEGKKKNTTHCRAGGAGLPSLRDGIEVSFSILRWRCEKGGERGEEEYENRRKGKKEEGRQA
jgi:hypothetical protein